MRPTFLGFEASKTALFASQKALDITGNNLANINSQGYTRQRVDQVSVNYMNPNTSAGYLHNQVALAGQGTNVIGIGQTRDKLLDTAYRNQSADVGDYATRSSIMTDIEDALQEFDTGRDGNGYGLRNAVSELFDALEDFSTDAGSPTYAAVTSDAFENVVRSIRETTEALDELSAKYKDSLSTDVNDVNLYFKEIVDYNKRIKDALVSNDYTSEYGPNELLDARNKVLDELSAYGELGISYNKDGTINVSLGGKTAVKGLEMDELMYSENTDGTVNVLWKSEAVPADTGKGILMAQKNMLNGSGLERQNNTETTDRGIRYYKEKIDSFAVRFAAICNTTIPDQVDADGNVLSYKKLIGCEMPDGEVYPDMHVDANNIWITDDLSESATYLLNKNGKDIDNTGLLNLTAKLTNSQFEFDGFTGTFENFVSDYVVTLGSDLSYVNENYEAAVTVGNNISEMRDSVTGVSETEETANMLMYNRAFQAASRMMTVMDDLLDVIINQMAV
ncbi:MAG: flagellar hook-associated protein FlgK [Ruminococcus sp.]|nr:flagellar hook-associated protein FlgK [Ruminococcus sp.]